MSGYSSSQSLVNAAIVARVKNSFISEVGLKYQVNEKWLDKTIDKLVYILNAKAKSTGEVIDLNDKEIIIDCSELIINQICDVLYKSINEV
ncbi:hypothetical protein AB6F25_22730 [Vibrio splendidus]